MATSMHSGVSEEERNLHDSHTDSHGFTGWHMCASVLLEGFAYVSS